MVCLSVSMDNWVWMSFWVSMGVYECLWVFIGVMGIYGYLWPSIDDGYFWVSMDVTGVYRRLWAFMGFWMSMTIYGCPWVYILVGVYGCLWVPIGVFRFLGVYGYLWVSWGFIGVHGGLWVSGYLWVLTGAMNVYIWTLKILPIFSFKNPRRFENSTKRLKSYMCYKK